MQSERTATRKGDALFFGGITFGIICLMILAHLILFPTYPFIYGTIEVILLAALLVTIDEGCSPDSVGDLEAATTSNPRRSLRAIWQSIYEEHREGITGVVITLAIVGTLYGAAFSTYSVLKHNARTQVIQRAQKMDGEVYTIYTIDYSLVGDTRLYLKDAQGRKAGHISLSINNPFTAEIHPLYLTMLGRGNEPIPVPMKVRVRYRAEEWKTQSGFTRDAYTGSFLTIEKLKK